MQKPQMADTEILDALWEDCCGIPLGHTFFTISSTVCLLFHVLANAAQFSEKPNLQYLNHF